MQLTPFVHYFEIFVGSNAAVAGYSETRMLIYEFFGRMSEHKTRNLYSKTQERLTYISIKVNAFALKNPEELDRIPHELKNLDEEFNKFESSASIILDQLDIAIDRAENSSDTATEDDVKDSSNVAVSKADKFQKNSDDKKILKWLIFCLIYCFMLILICGFEETYPLFENNVDVFLSVFNTIIVVGFIFNRIFQFVLKRLPSTLFKFLVSIDKKRSDSFSKNNKYYFVRRHIWRFCCIFIISLVLTILNCQALNKGIIWYSFNDKSMLVLLISILFICAFPLLFIIMCAVEWNTTKLTPLYKDMKKKCAVVEKLGKRFDDWHIG